MCYRHPKAQRTKHKERSTKNEAQRTSPLLPQRFSQFPDGVGGGRLADALAEEGAEGFVDGHGAVDLGVGARRVGSHADQVFGFAIGCQELAGFVVNSSGGVRIEPGSPVFVGLEAEEAEAVGRQFAGPVQQVELAMGLPEADRRLVGEHDAFPACALHVPQVHDLGAGWLIEAGHVL